MYIGVPETQVFVTADEEHRSPLPMSDLDNIEIWVVEATPMPEKDVYRRSGNPGFRDG